MIALDTNVLVYAHRSDIEQFAIVAPKMRALAQGGESWGIPFPCAHEFFAIVTNAKLWKTPTTTKRALEQLDAWAESPSFTWLNFTESHFEALKTLCINGRVSGGQIHDARIAALCIENGVRELWTADRDFSRFPALRTFNPLVS